MDEPNRRRLNVTFIGLGAFGAHGGIQRFNRRVIDVLNEGHCGSKVIMLGDWKCVPDHYGLPAGSFVGCAGSRWLFVTQFIRSLPKTDILVLGHINLLPLAVLFRALRPSRRTVLFAHGVEVWGDPSYRRPRRWEPSALRAAIDKIAIVSVYSQGLMARAFGLKLEQFSLFPNAVDVTDRENAKRSSPIILAVSRLAITERGKHIDKLIKSLPKVLENVPDSRLVVVGDGELLPELRGVADSCGVSDNVEFLGSVSDSVLADLFRQAAVFALPSSKEGFGIVFLEAWLRGLPVVGSQFGAAAEVIEDGVDGITVDPQDTDALAGALSRLLLDRDLSTSMAEKGRKKVLSRYSHDNFRVNFDRLMSALSG
ncbi:glycosyltransferase family 4 protein [Novosphingobium cyanobacteriorum]|uniref:Glycosyltransferase family 4 protein n=1 Tax=Novosphingobium cyanobacteriorum TaxID=3024215 RepID=A0ABT6CR57_9SPHN|nr:glycosyltransferase family 4 protein [Novosphingobium cyanobacteriorum]MDF8334997.1 glycosyltransferase family 4 protein [Novosphingobium cyanobacteriorum]